MEWQLLARPVVHAATDIPAVGFARLASSRKFPGRVASLTSIFAAVIASKEKNEWPVATAIGVATGHSIPRIPRIPERIAG
jgi:hypothetical protein